MQKKYLQVCGKSEFLNMKYWLAASPLKLYIALKNKLGEGPYRTGWQAPVGQSRDSFGIHGLSLKSQKKKKKKKHTKLKEEKVILGTVQEHPEFLCLTWV